MRVRACSFYLSAQKGLIGQRSLRAMFARASPQVRLFPTTDLSAVMGFIHIAHDRRWLICLGVCWAASSNKPHALIQAVESENPRPQSDLIYAIKKKQRLRTPMILDLENPPLSRDPAVEAAAFVRARANARARTPVDRAGNPFFHHSHAAAQHLARLQKLVGKRAAAALIAEAEGRQMRCVSQSPAQSMKSHLHRRRKAAA
jgi:hypothetical protein